MRALVCCIGAMLLLASSAALADDEIVKGSVVKVEQQEIYVSLGSKQGVGDGAKLRVKRTIKLKHPVTRATVEDWIPVGAATVTQAGSSLSRAVVGELVDSIKVGDLVEVLVDHPDAKPAPTPTPTPTPAQPLPQVPPQPAADPAAVEVLGIFAAQTGQPLEARIAGWERYLSTRGASPYADAIRKDVETMRDLREQMRPTAGAATNDVVTTVDHQPGTTAVAHAELPLVFVLVQPDRVASAFLHYRTAGSPTFHSKLLVREHDIYLRGAIPADVVTPPGVEYFVEVSTPNGASGLALGSPAQPVSLAVAPPPLTDQFGAAPGLSSVMIAADYRDFATLDKRMGDHRDHMVTATVDFVYRLRSWVQAIGVGYGVYAGQGGFADRVYDTSDPAPRSGFHFGYADVEVGGPVETVPVSFGIKGIAGVGRDGFGLGVESRLRIGARDRTSLVFSANTISQIGFLSDIMFSSRVAPKLVAGVSVGATDQPNKGDIGVVLASQLEWIGFDNVSILVRASWQGRDIDHGGLGGGGGVGVRW